MALDKTASFVTKAVSVTPSDTVDCVAGLLYVGVSGDVKVDTLDGDTVILKNMVQGIVHPIYVKRVHSTSTTATNIFTCA